MVSYQTSGIVDSSRRVDWQRTLDSTHLTDRSELP